MPSVMACPFFYPTQHLVDRQTRPMPLGDIYAGECRAQSGGYHPSAEQLRSLCNLGYARQDCPRFPDTAGPDAVRFAMAEETPETLRIDFVREKDHHPLENGHLEYSVAEKHIAPPHEDPILNRLAETYAESHLRRKVV